MRPATHRFFCFYLTAWLAAEFVQEGKHSFWLGTIRVIVLAVFICISASYGWPDPEPASADDSPLPPESLDLGNKTKVGAEP